MEDRLTRGFVAGIVGGLATNVWSMFAGAINMTTVRQADLIAMLVYAHIPPFDWGEITFALLSHILLSGILGIIFVYWISRVTSRNLLLKGWIFSVAIYFAAEIIPTLFQVPGTIPTPFRTVICDFVGASIFGLVLPLILRVITVKENAISPAVLMNPAMKPLDQEEDKDKN